jgi:hypothetical protein
MRKFSANPNINRRSTQTDYIVMHALRKRLMKNNIRRSCNAQHAHIEALCDLGHLEEAEDQVNTFLHYVCTCLKIHKLQVS